MKRIFICCFAILLFCSCASKLQKIEGVFISEANIERNEPLFFSFDKDSLFIKSHYGDFDGYILDYTSKEIFAKNDSTTFKIIPDGFGYTIFPQSLDSVHKLVKVSISPVKTIYNNTKKIVGYWESNGFGHEETHMYINDENEIVYTTYYDGEILNYSGWNGGTTVSPRAKIIEFKKNYYYVASGPFYTTALIDYLSDNKIQFFTKHGNEKNYFHDKRINFEILHKELKEIVLKKEKDSTRFDFEGGGYMKIITSDYEEETIDTIINIK